MSKKNTKITVKYPKYEMEGQVKFLYGLCQELNFDYEHLLTLIFADWIANFQDAYSKTNGNLSAVFVTYLESTKLTNEKLMKVKEYVERFGQNDNSSFESE